MIRLQVDMRLKLDDAGWLPDDMKEALREKVLLRDCHVKLCAGWSATSAPAKTSQSPGGTFRFLIQHSAICRRKTASMGTGS